MPGHGKSESAQGMDFSWELLISSIKALLNRLALPSVHLIGHGGGGVLGLEMAKKEKQLLRTLILAATPIYIPKDFTQQEMKNRIEVVNDCSKFEELTAQLAQTVSYNFSDTMLAKLTAIYKSVTAYDYIGYFKLVTETILDYSMEEIGQLDIPMMMLQGEYDPLFPLEMQVMNIPYLKNMRFFIIPDSGHVLMMDQPWVFSQFSNMFIKKQSGTGGIAFTYTDALKKEVNSIVRSGIKKQESQHQLETNVIDRFSIWLNGKEIEGKWNQRKAKELITYLAYHQSVTREQIYDLYWPEQPLDKARNLLRVSLNHIKSIIENHTGEPIENYVEINRDSIHMKVPCKLDLQELYDSIDEIEQTSDYELKAELAIKGFSELPDPLFPLFYDDWFLKIRTTLESRIIRICEELLDAPPEKETAIELLRILVKLDPGEEFYQEQLISLLQHTNRLREARYFRNKSDSSFL
jgi:pimeloyl-ACP methyl ester carboxylesterase/DNA-binding SARP family transcriptional activator